MNSLNCSLFPITLPDGAKKPILCAQQFHLLYFEVLSRTTTTLMHEWMQKNNLFKGITLIPFFLRASQHTFFLQMCCQIYLKSKYTNTAHSKMWAELNKSSPAMRSQYIIRLLRLVYVRTLQATFSEEGLSAMDHQSAHTFFSVLC